MPSLPMSCLSLAAFEPAAGFFHSALAFSAFSYSLTAAALRDSDRFLKPGISCGLTFGFQSPASPSASAGMPASTIAALPVFWPVSSSLATAPGLRSSVEGLRTSASSILLPKVLAKSSSTDFRIAALASSVTSGTPPTLGSL